MRRLTNSPKNVTNCTENAFTKNLIENSIKLHFKNVLKINYFLRFLKFLEFFGLQIPKGPTKF